jgi:hypothetical protein
MQHQILTEETLATLNTRYNAQTDTLTVNCYSVLVFHRGVVVSGFVVEDIVKLIELISEC